MMRWLWPVVVLTALSTELLGEPPRLQREQLEERIETLIEKADPQQDDWMTEQLQDRAGAQLKVLAGLLEGEAWDSPALSAVIDPQSKATALRPPSPQSSRVPGGFEVLRGGGSPEGAQDLAVDRALRDWRRAWGTRDAHVKFKIISVEQYDPETFSTEVRCELSGDGHNRPLQQTNRWRIQWVRDSSAEVPRIRGLELLAFEQVRAQRRLFTDCTTTLLSGVTGWSDQLQFGADYWYGKIDAVGELNFMGHHGIAVGDVNGDGREDLYVAMGTGLPNKLLVRSEDGTLQDRAEQAGVAWLDDTKGVLFADMDNDGDQDLLCALGPTIVLCKNDGRGRFNRFVRHRAKTPAAFYSLAVADYDLDGDLDIYGCRYVKVSYGVSIPVPFHDANNGPTNLLLRNEGRDVYVDATDEVGLGVNNSRFSLACAWVDYDRDGDADLYVANDFGRNNLYRNDGGRFVDVAGPAGVEDQAAGMGVSWSDYDGDGDLDLHVSNMFSSAGRRIAYQSRFQSSTPDAERRQIQQHSLGDTLLVNQGDGTFLDRSDPAGIRMGRWAWGGRFVDFNNDGYEDLVVPNGFLTNERIDDL